MAIEAGGKAGLFPVDGVTQAYEEARGIQVNMRSADEEAVYSRSLEIDLSTLEPTVARPFLPDNGATISTLAAEKIKIDQVVIGSCTNGRIEDLRAAAAVLGDEPIAEGLRCIILPGSQEVYLQAMREGLTEKFVSAGCAFSTPTCGPCLGGHMGVLAEKEVAVSTTNRNFVGRMGHVSSEVYLASPVVAAASAVKGYLCGPDTAALERLNE
jgi:3-isopropylmalate/(R)-2-methylmalate dehydratase large subunit